MIRNLFILLFTCCCFAKTYGKLVPADSTAIKTDSARFKEIQKKLEGCWDNGSFQFKYDIKTNTGYEYNTRVHSSAPFFTLILKDNYIYLDWVELTGGGYLLKIIDITEETLKTENEEGDIRIYSRNKGCKLP